MSISLMVLLLVVIEGFRHVYRWWHPRPDHYHYHPRAHLPL